MFAYLAERYDKNGDGIIEPAEYNRPGGTLVHLDRTQDGVLTADDFTPKGRRVRGMGVKEAKRLRAVYLVSWYMQADDNPIEVLWDEVRSSFAEYDADKNGRVGRREFERIAPERSRRGLRAAGKWAGLLEAETTDPWGRMIAAFDTDDNGFMTLAEVERFYFANKDEWIFPQESIGVAAPDEGQLAPDFELSSPAGNQTARLSDFAGERPVALIFGSYT